MFYTVLFAASTRAERVTRRPNEGGERELTTSSSFKKRSVLSPRRLTHTTMVFVRLFLFCFVQSCPTIKSRCSRNVKRVVRFGPFSVLHIFMFFKIVIITPGVTRACGTKNTNVNKKKKMNESETSSAREKISSRTRQRLETRTKTRVCEYREIREGPGKRRRELENCRRRALLSL